MDKVEEDLTRAQLWALELYQRQLLRTTRRLRELPEEESSLRRRLEESEKGLKDLEGELKTKQMEQKHLEMDADGVKERRTRHQQQLLTAKDNREYKTLLEEIELEKGRQSEVEDRILELMEGIEELFPRVREARAESERTVSEAQSALAAVAVEGENLRKRLAKLGKERTALVERLNPVGRRIFDKLSAQPHVCALVDGAICASCHMEVPTQTQSEIRSGSLKSCESCSAVLFTEEQASVARTMARNLGFTPDDGRG
ncbi:MAG TPA: C4-type zinc ribbon domain-containing protein [bacterium]|nr:C4-type zinc ribbon domain-containing protein [bacterium]